MIFPSREPEWDDVDPDASEVRTASTGYDDASHFERRISPFESLPHLCSKGLTNVEMEPLVAAILNIEEQDLEPALYAHPSFGQSIVGFPEAFVRSLQSAAESILRKFAESSSAKMWAIENGLSGGSKANRDFWTTDQALTILKPIAELARQRTSCQSMYLLMKW